MLGRVASVSIHLVSEQLRYPFLGKMSLSVDGVAGGECRFGGQPIPLLPLVYRHSVIYGGSGGGVEEPQNRLFYNSRPGRWYYASSDRADITDYFYLGVVPWFKTHNRTSSRSAASAVAPRSG